MKYDTIWRFTGHGYRGFRAEIDVWELGKLPLEDSRRILRKLVSTGKCGWTTFDGQNGFEAAADAALERVEAERADLNTHGPDELGLLPWFWELHKELPTIPKDREKLHEQLWDANAKHRQRLHKLKDFYKTL